MYREDDHKLFCQVYLSFQNFPPNNRFVVRIVELEEILQLELVFLSLEVSLEWKCFLEIQEKLPAYLNGSLKSRLIDDEISNLFYVNSFIYLILISNLYFYLSYPVSLFRNSSPPCFGLEKTVPTNILSLW